ncbi:Glycosyltransferase involved in cell wall bisynthesis OS=Bosea thiooxidans OX=53254 GN=SAMN05660750_04435 PE=4 SV=1 [Bosea thiooxidans]|uniref:Glycosyltransferase involved in cell wall bisynthesis n=1 Tax=Bosea thiooxidans TaxID=53254 RepID=A0A1T5GV66_9HYPH|nr:glycosyltransferase [Bosea thiooxidans]SKC12286.1 Glycosyltransferase involved in cell wall bisynthesis [Bosea thiooxidans]
MNNHNVRALRIAVLSYTAIARDYRVVRTLETLSALGHDVTAIGFGEAPALPVAMIRLPDPPGRTIQRLTVAATQFPANLMPASAPLLHMLVPQHRAARAALLSLRPDIVHANDWQALVAANAVKRAAGTRIVYDSHEMASEEHADNKLWRLVAQKHTRAIEARYIRVADAVVTVSDGIAHTLKQLYGLPARPVVIGNAPAYQSVTPAPPGMPIRLLFHGIMKRARGIEPLIKVMPLLPQYQLTLRGGGASRYLQQLQQLAAASGAGDRIVFEPSVPYDAVIRAAANAHVGVFCAPRDTGQGRYAMPNKIYEYLMAGLAVLVAADTDLAKLVTQYQCGLVTTDATPEAIAAALAALDPDKLAIMRANALIAARQLCWEQERTKLLALYDWLAEPDRLH